MLQNFLIGFFIVFGVIGVFTMMESLCDTEKNAAYELYVNQPLYILFFNYMGTLFMIAVAIVIITGIGWFANGIVDVLKWMATPQ